MFYTYTILVDGMLFTWNGSHQPDFWPLSEKAYWSGSLGSHYYPTITPNLPKVQVFTALFNTSKEWEIWMSHLQMHPGCPSPEAAVQFLLTCPISGGERPIPIKSCMFEMEVLDSSGVKFWWVKDNIQKKPWD